MLRPTVYECKEKAIIVAIPSGNTKEVDNLSIVLAEVQYFYMSGDTLIVSIRERKVNFILNGEDKTNFAHQMRK